MAASTDLSADNVPVVSLRFSAVKLQKRDLLTGSDPFAVVYISDPSRKEQWTELGRTETLRNAPNPEWVALFEIKFVFELLQEIRVCVYDRDCAKEDLSLHDYIGSCEFSLAQAVTNSATPLTLSLINENKHNLKPGYLIVSAEPRPDTEPCTVYLDLGVHWISTGPPHSRQYFQIKRQRSDGSWTVVYQSKPSRPFDKKVRWKSAVVSLQSLTGGQADCPLIFTIYGQRRVSASRTSNDGLEKAYAEVSYNELLQLSPGGSKELCQTASDPNAIFTKLIRRRSQQNQRSMPCGNLIVYSCREVKEYEFSDFILGGCEILFTIAIDFTSSNGNPVDPNSRHYKGSSKQERKTPNGQSQASEDELLQSIDSLDDSSDVVKGSQKNGNRDKLVNEKALQRAVNGFNDPNCFESDDATPGHPNEEVRVHNVELATPLQQIRALSLSTPDHSDIADEKIVQDIHRGPASSHSTSRAMREPVRKQVSHEDDLSLGNPNQTASNSKISTEYVSKQKIRNGILKDTSNGPMRRSAEIDRLKGVEIQSQQSNEPSVEEIRTASKDPEDSKSNSQKSRGSPENSPEITEETRNPADEENGANVDMQDNDEKSKRESGYLIDELPVFSFEDYKSVSRNEYELAIRVLTAIFAPFASEEEQYYSLGFGACVPPDFEVSHCFPLGGEPTCNGVQGIIQNYRRTLEDVQLHGPTCLGKLISFVASIAARRKVTQDDQHYHVLLILTDGAVADMRETINAIINASSLPLSIIIIGLGDEDFSRMINLDSSSMQLKSGDKQAVRDILQFIPFQGIDGDLDKLRSEILNEFPRQLKEYMKLHSIRPADAVVDDAEQNNQ